MTFALSGLFLSFFLLFSCIFLYLFPYMVERCLILFFSWQFSHLPYNTDLFRVNIQSFFSLSGGVGGGRGGGPSGLNIHLHSAARHLM